MLIVHDNIDSDDGIDFNIDDISSNDKLFYSDDHVTVEGDKIEIYKENKDYKVLKNKIYFISSINSIEIIEKNILLKELLALLFGQSILYGLIWLGMDATGASNNSLGILFNIYIAVIIFSILLISFMHYRNRFFIQISTSSGKEYIYFSKYSSKINAIFDTIVAIKNSK